MANEREMKELRRELVREGWRVEQGRKHYKAYHPKGGFVSLSVSSSDYYAVKNARGDVARLKRQHGEPV